MLKPLFLCLLSGLLCFHCAVAQSVIFVAPNGNDQYPGTIDKPLLTMEKAQIIARGIPQEVTIFLRAGHHRLKQTLVFTADDTKRAKKLTIKSYPGEKAVLNAAEVLDLQWTPYKSGIFRAKLRNHQEMDMLIVSGDIRPLARFPNYDSTAVRFHGTAAEATAKERVKTWKNPIGGFVHGMHAHDWGDFHYRITGRDSAGNLQLEGGHQNNRKLELHPTNRMVENIFEELDAPGEWFYDKQEEWLYYYPYEQEAISKLVFEAPRLKHLIELRGMEQAPVRDITFEGLSFTGTQRTFMEPYEPLLRSDWTIYRGAAILLEGTEDCSIRDADFFNLGGNAVFLSKFIRKVNIVGNHFFTIGASAICVVGDPDAVRSPNFEYSEFTALENMDLTKGPKTGNYPSFCSIDDNLIHNIGLFEKQVTGIELSMCYAITVSHNSIYDTPRAGINVSEGTWGGHIIEFNDVFDNVKETGDHGAFNSWGRDRFWHPDFEQMCQQITAKPTLALLDVVTPITLRNNRFRCDRGWDIDLDDGSSNYLIYNNLCLNGGIKLREGFSRVVTNNIFVNNSLHPHVWFAKSADVFSRNIVMSAFQPVRLEGWGAMVDYNIFSDSTSLLHSQELEVNQHAIVSTFDFANPTAGNYRIIDTATAIFQLGFQNFDMDNFGVRSPRLQKIARKPHFSLPLIQKGEVQAEPTTDWMGFKIKNLTTLGERSATGMDAERGVYVIGLKAYDTPFKDYLRSNDVILDLSGHAVNAVDDLLKAVSILNLERSHELLIFRDQQEVKIKLPAGVLK